jgi:hypothetical protein
MKLQQTKQNTTERDPERAFHFSHLRLYQPAAGAGDSKYNYKHLDPKKEKKRKRKAIEIEKKRLCVSSFNLSYKCCSYHVSNKYFPSGCTLEPQEAANTPMQKRRHQSKLFQRERKSGHG